MRIILPPTTVSSCCAGARLIQGTAVTECRDSPVPSSRIPSPGSALCPSSITS
jgi:hypothetical protein